MNRSTTRRALIGGAGLIAVTVVSQCVPAPVQGQASAISPRLLRAIALRDQADAEYTRFYDTVEEPTQEALAAALAAFRPDAPPPHREVATTFENMDGDAVRLSTDGFSASVARSIRDDPAWAGIGAEQPEWTQAHIELADLADERDAIISMQEGRKAAHAAAARSRLNIDAINRRSDDLGKREYRLWCIAVEMPAQSLADVTAKLDMIDRLGRGDEGEYILQAIAKDVRSLTGGRAA